MNCNWPTVELGKYCSKIGSGATPRGGSNVYLDRGEITLIRSQNIYNDGFKAEGLVYITSEAAQKLKNVIIEPNDILINITGDSVARVCLAPEDYLPARVNQHVAILRVKPDEFDHRYLRYFLTSTKMQNYLLTIASTGGTRNALTKSMLESLEVSKPPLSVQKKIGDVLEQFENKILLNTKTSQTLEQIAQTIFKSWLVDFDPVKAKMNGEQPKGMDAATASLFPEKLVESELGLIPDGWVVGELSKLFELHRGFDLPKSKRQQGGYPVYAAGGYHGNHNEFKMEPPGIITGRSGVIGNVYLSLDKYWPLNTTLYVREFRACGPYYAYHLLRSLDLKSLNSGSAVPSLNRNFVHSTSVCHPDSEILAKFEEIVKPLFEKMVANNEQNKSLSELRDALLPKLLSGEIDLDASGSFAVDKLVGALLEQLDFGIEFKLSQQSLPKGYIGLITVSGTFGSNGGTHVHVPTAVKALSKLTTAEGTYGEIVGNVATETLTSGAVELVTNNIIPLGVLTKVCTAVFGKKTPIKPKDAVLLTTIHEATNKSIDGILNEQAKRFAFLELPCMDEQELEQSLQYLESIGVVKCNGKTIVLLDSIVQH